MIQTRKIGQIALVGGLLLLTIVVATLLAQSVNYGSRATAFAAPGTTSLSTSCPYLTHSLWRGMSGSDVIGLQQFLIQQNLLASKYATGYFGFLTQTAVRQFQSQQGITAIGIVGPITRAAITRVCVGTISGNFTASPQFGEAPLAVRFTSTAPPGGNIGSSINFGDGVSDTLYPAPVCATCDLQGSASHTYTSPGTYTATLSKVVYNDCTPQPGMVCAAWYSREEVIGTVTITVSVSGLGQTISKTEGEQEGSFLIQKINADNVDGLWYQAYPVGTNQGSPRTLHIGDDIGYACEGVSEKLVSIDYVSPLSGMSRNSTATFYKTVSNPPMGGCPICLASNTKIATPSGEMNVKDIVVGTHVWSQNARGEKVESVVVEVSKMPVPATHHVVHLVLKDGREVWVSPGHPVQSGAPASSLKTGDVYDGSRITLAENILYWDSYTYDLLPDSDTGFYWANDIILGSTLNH